VLFEKADMSQSFQSRDFYHLGILEVILGAGMPLGVLLSPLLTHISYSIWDKFGRTIIFTIAILGFTVFSLSYIFGFRTAWTRLRLIFVISIGAFAVGSLISVFCTITYAESSFRFYLFLSGLPFFLAGYGIVTNRNWSNTIQRVFCFLFAAAMFYLAFLSWRIPNTFALVCVVIALPAIHLTFTLQDLEFREMPRISIRAFLLILSLTWLSVVTIGIPNFINAEQRKRQRKTMVNLNVVANAVNYYAEEHNSYPPTQSIHDLAKLLEPKYIKGLPLIDGWEFAIEYYGTVFENNAFQGYVIRSPGRDGKFEYKDPTKYKDGAVEGFERDIVFSIGSMSQWPEGYMPP
jgi:hypothetical protein